MHAESCLVGVLAKSRTQPTLLLAAPTADHCPLTLHCSRICAGFTTLLDGVTSFGIYGGVNFCGGSGSERLQILPSKWSFRMRCPHILQMELSHGTCSHFVSKSSSRVSVLRLFRQIELSRGTFSLFVSKSSLTAFSCLDFGFLGFSSCSSSVSSFFSVCWLFGFSAAWLCFFLASCYFGLFGFLASLRT